MTCPKCFSKTHVIDVRNNLKENEVYRYRVCNSKMCNHKFCTVEFIAEENNGFKESWNKARKGGR